MYTSIYLQEDFGNISNFVINLEEALSLLIQLYKGLEKDKGEKHLMKKIKTALELIVQVDYIMAKTHGYPAVAGRKTTTKYR